MASIRQMVNGKWRALIRIKGHRNRCKTFPNKARAEAWAKDTEAQIRSGVVPAGTVADLIQAYRELREASRPVLDTSNEHYMLRHLEERLGEHKAHLLVPNDLVDFAKGRKLDGAGVYTVNMEVSKLGTVYKYAGLGMNLPDVVGKARPLLAHLGLIGGGGKRERRPTEDELSRIIDALPPHFRPAVRMMVAIGLRRGEVCRLRWEDIDHAKKLILVRDRKDPRAKKGNDQWVPLIRGAWELVSRIHMADRPEGPIFNIHPQTLSKTFKATCDRLGIPDLHLHDLRHHAISEMFESGMSIEQVALVSGHSSWTHLKRYTNLRPELLHAHPSEVARNERQRPRLAQIVSLRRGKSE